MCIIIAKPSGKLLPKYEVFSNCESKNRDGIGVAINKGGIYSEIKKDFLNAKECFDYLTNNTTPDDLVIVHFRFATSGELTPEFRHPYPISKDVNELKMVEKRCKKLVAHNGVLSQYTTRKDTNDTMEFIITALSENVIKNNLNNPTIQKLLEEHIGGDKLAIIDRGNLILIGKFVEDEGLFYSNSDYQSKWYYPAMQSADYCEYCDSLKKVLAIEYKGMSYKLCKTCRKKLNKGELTVDEILYGAYGAYDRDYAYGTPRYGGVHGCY